MVDGCRCSRCLRSERLPNPLSEATVEQEEMPGHRDESESRRLLRDSVRRAEKFFRVESEDEILGCGSRGCAVPLKDGRVLKITTSKGEIDLFRHLAKMKPEAARGFVTLFSKILTVPFGWAYVRERIDGKLPRDGNREVASDLLRRLPHTFGTAERSAVLADLERVPGWGDVVRSVRALDRAGVSVTDLHPYNVGTRANGDVVAFDAGAGE